MVGVISTYFIMKDEIIWTAQFNYLYEVIVKRIKPYKGVLTVTNIRNNETLLVENVTLTNNANKGPDYYDVIQWQQIAHNIANQLLPENICVF